MAVMAREAWTDERLDDLNGRMDKGFDELKERIREVKGEIREVKGEIRDTKGEVKELRKEMNARFDAVDARFDAMQRTLVLGLVGMTASIVASVIGGVFAAVALS
jgi:chromosome segregation ATPase